MKKTLGIIFLSIVGVFVYIILPIWNGPLSRRDAPVYFSLDDTNAMYTIDKTEGPVYWVSYHPKNPNDGVQVLVGNSLVKLDPYVGKNVHITGRYDGHIGDRQCIQSVCNPKIGGAMIDIQKIKIIK